VLTPRQNDAVIALTELIIPATDTPGAKAALVNRFVDHVLSTADTKESSEFIRGLAWLDDRCRTPPAQIDISGELVAARRSNRRSQVECGSGKSTWSGIPFAVGLSSLLDFFWHPLAPHHISFTSAES
jgi:hypothetical protein